MKKFLSILNILLFGAITGYLVLVVIADVSGHPAGALANWGLPIGCALLNLKFKVEYILRWGYLFYIGVPIIFWMVLVGSQPRILSWDFLAILTSTFLLRLLWEEIELRRERQATTLQ